MACLGFLSDKVAALLKEQGVSRYIFYSLEGIVQGELYAAHRIRHDNPYVKPLGQYVKVHGISFHQYSYILVCRRINQHEAGNISERFFLIWLSTGRIFLRRVFFSLNEKRLSVVSAPGGSKILIGIWFQDSVNKVPVSLCSSFSYIENEVAVLVQVVEPHVRIRIDTPYSGQRGGQRLVNLRFKAQGGWRSDILIKIGRVDTGRSKLHRH